MKPKQKRCRPDTTELLKLRRLTGYDGIMAGVLAIAAEADVRALWRAVPDRARWSRLFQYAIDDVARAMASRIDVTKLKTLDDLTAARAELREARRKVKAPVYRAAANDDGAPALVAEIYQFPKSTTMTAEKERPAAE